MLPIAVDAMGGDNAPSAIVAGARRAVDELGIPVVLVGRAAELGDTGGLEVIEASEVIAMDADAGSSVRKMKDSSLVRAAEAVRDGRASAMVSAGNTGATMASALLRMGRIKGVQRPAIATPIPVPGFDTPTVLLDAGANAECSADWLVQFAQMGAVFAKQRFGITSPRVGLLSIGEEPTKGNPLVKETHKLLAEGSWIGATGAQFIGNVEGRDIMTDDVDVVVTDGFTGNVALKTLEGSLKSIINSLLAAFDSSDEARAAAAALWPSLLPLYDSLDPENTGGAMLLGVDGVCIISHGSSSDRAMVNAVRVAADMVTANVVGHIAATVRPAD
ncbi:MAG: phosphate acyltransferase PlsX [Actinobacteria bacterium]|uniref:phosphate acyltransferase n=1 Tax=freshwater metagenome TaxID=449393 RepID=A0A6J6I1J1_9ZZZZ|nr:phosphate acyltransferase PlsX [Actinomycetota bacterium]MSY33568.1 phosphate acyltransferase PlsX [Actinomycetota bacterium]MSZ51793.1 phosphate acyltransferase PlsX [Actinomycetota bacterium]MTA44578.1 phosphate acyltransferase PlsX [Actinomycetota bacterium]MTB22352.1 phosphate acyltransferase PlsX [Actinomycetota bacterium]